MRKLALLGALLVGTGSTSTLLLVACSSFSAADPAPDATTAADAGEDRIDPDASPPLFADAMSEDASPGDGFPRTPLVPIAGGAYSIEASEVTVAQFRAFKTKYGPEAGAPWAKCSAKLTLGPKTSCNGATTGDTQPMTCVDWCDAQAYCAAIGRHLCGNILGGSVTFGSENDVTVDQWAHACRGKNGTAWPYGNVASSGACNTKEGDAKAPVPGQSYPACTGEPGVFDMSGNVAEWENACNTPGSTEQCILRGGSYLKPATESACDNTVRSAPNAAYPDVGFRCCAD